MSKLNNLKLAKARKIKRKSSNSKKLFLTESKMLTNIHNNSAPVREGKVQKAKKRLAAGFYSSPKVVSLVAERIIQDLKYFKTSYPA